MLTLSSDKGTGGAIKNSPQDFLVREITANGTVLQLDRAYKAGELEDEVPDGKFTTFVLQKKNWNTIEALVKIAKNTRRGRKSIGYAGAKDRTSLSVQLASVYGIKPEDLERVRIRDISINGAWKSNGIELGSNIGNSFSISIINADSSVGIDNIVKSLNGMIPNYFDKQRFGSRLYNCRIGLRILNNDFKSAALEFLTGTENEDNSDVVNARKRLKEEMDFTKALDYFPRYLRNERTVLFSLSQYNTNYAGALRKLPRGISMMFIHAVQAYIFNMSLQKRIKEMDFKTGVYCKANGYGFPDIDNLTERNAKAFPAIGLVGYETNDSLVSDYEREVMEKIGVTKESFRIPGMPELGMRGTTRPILAPFKDFSHSINDEIKVNFSLPSGSYATIFLNEIMKNQGFELESVLM